jgi:hypothetical protein
MNNAPINVANFETVLTAEERELLTHGRRGPRVKRDALTGERLFATMQGRRSYRSRRGEFRTFA